MIEKTDKDKIIKSIKIIMDPDLLKKFREIKDHLGVHADAEVVRALINYYYRNEVEVAKRKAQVG